MSRPGSVAQFREAQLYLLYLMLFTFISIDIKSYLLYDVSLYKPQQLSSLVNVRYGVEREVDE